MSDWVEVGEGAFSEDDCSASGGGSWDKTISSVRVRMTVVSEEGLSEEWDSEGSEVIDTWVSFLTLPFFLGCGCGLTIEVSGTSF